MALYEEFHQFERDYDLFEVTPGGYPIWERIRGKMFKRAQAARGVVEPSSVQTGAQEGYREALVRWLKRGVSGNPYFAGHHDILFHGHPRRKRLDDGFWWDIYCDPIHLQSDLDALHLESPRDTRHARPARTPNIRYTDFVELSGSLLRQLGIGDAAATDPEREQLERAGRGLHDRFGVDADLVDWAEIILEERATLKPLYELLLRRIDPELAVVVVSYRLETFVEACKERGVPVAELQHGVIHDRHLAYSFPGGRTKRAFPDYLLTWGEFWNEAVDYPIPDERLVPVGYPFLDLRERKYEDVDERDEIVFVSQAIVGESLSRFAVDVSERTDFDVIYKLHPDEADGWRSRYPWLADADLSVVTDSPPLYELFARASAQVGVGSTAVYEGLAFGLQTFVYDLEAAEMLAPLVENGTATLIDDPEALCRELGSESHGFDRQRYFAPRPVERFESACERIANTTL